MCFLPFSIARLTNCVRLQTSGATFRVDYDTLTLINTRNRLQKSLAQMQKAFLKNTVMNSIKSQQSHRAKLRGKGQRMSDLLKGSSVQHFTARLQAQTEKQQNQASEDGREGEDSSRRLTCCLTTPAAFLNPRAFNAAVLWILIQV